MISRNVALILIFLSLIAFMFVTKDYIEHLNTRNAKEIKVILAFGDSLTKGFGVESEFSYPSQLQKKSGIRVINAGVNGEPSGAGLLRLEELLKEKPDVVILCHGANDILRNLSAVKLKENLLSMIKLIKQSGAEVLLVGVPGFRLDLKTHPLYKEVAKESGVMYEDKILTKIERDRTLKSDQVHPNEKGYEMMADTFRKMLRL